MKYLFLLVNNACDIACTYCFYTTGYEKRFPKHIRPEQAATVAGRITDIGFRTVILTGGDPLHSKLKNKTYVLARELKARERRVIINTSAVYLDDADLDTIVALGIDRIDVSIDSHRADIHDAQRGRHADAVRTITGLIECGYRSITTTTVVTEANASTLAETVRWLRDLGVEDVRIQRAFLPEEAGDSRELVTLGMRQACSHLPSPYVRDYIELTERALSNEQPLPMASCRMGKEYFVCDAAGTLTPCFHRSDIMLGNLFSDPVDRLQEMLEKNALTPYVLPPCFGNHCTSLFDNPRFWRKEHETPQDCPAPTL